MSGQQPSRLNSALALLATPSLRRTAASQRPPDPLQDALLLVQCVEAVRAEHPREKQQQLTAECFFALSTAWVSQQERAWYRSEIAAVASRVSRITSERRQVVQRATQQHLLQVGASEAAVPNICACLQCGSALEVVPAPLTGGPAWFYRPDKPGAQGIVYDAHCSQCALLYDIEGYQHSSNASTAQGVKLPLPSEQRHADWVRVSSRTFLHRTFTQRYEVLLHSAHITFKGLCTAHNMLAMAHETWENAPQLGTLNRQELQEDGLAAGILRDQLLTEVGTWPPELAGNMDLKNPLDFLLQQAAGPRFEALLAEAHDHLHNSNAATCCGRAVVLDGNASSIRARCQCLRPSSQDKDVGMEQPVDGDAIFYRKFCLNTPVKTDLQRRCRECIAAGRSPNQLAPVDEAPPAQDDGAAPSDEPAGPGAARGDGKDPGARGTPSHPDPDLLVSRTSSVAHEAALPLPVAGQPTAPGAVHVPARRSARLAARVATAPRDSEPACGGSRKRKQPTETESEANRPGPVAGTTDTYYIDRVVGEKLGPDGTLYYRVKWQGWEARFNTWEPVQHFTDRVAIEEWRSACAANSGDVWEPHVPEAELLEDEPLDVTATAEVQVAQVEAVVQQQLGAAADTVAGEELRQQLGAALRAKGSTRSLKGKTLAVTFSKCGLRVGQRYAYRTAGGMWAMCPCGYLLPAVEMPDSESTRHALYSLMLLFPPGQPYPSREGGTFVFVYDDMCHLLRYAQARQHLHANIGRFCQDAKHAVDRFHFVHNHKGAWCDAMVNPERVPELEGVNTEVCEQRFRHINRYQATLRHMGRERFGWTLLTICQQDHKHRAAGRV